MQELNKIEWKREDHGKEVETGPVSIGHPGVGHLAEKSMFGKFHDYKSVDLRDIMSLFDEYHSIEKSIKNRL